MAMTVVTLPYQPPTVFRRRGRLDIFGSRTLGFSNAVSSSAAKKWSLIVLSLVQQSSSNKFSVLLNFFARGLRRKAFAMTGLVPSPSIWSSMDECTT